MSLWKNHSRLLLLLLLIPIAFGCQQPFKLSDAQLTEHMTKNTTDRTGKIVLTNGKIYDGFSLAIHEDSLQWSEEPNDEGKRHSAEVHNVESVTIHAQHDGWPLYFGLGGCTAGGCAGLMVSFIKFGADNANSTNNNTESFNWTIPVISAVAGSGLGVAGGYLFDPGFQQNAWILKTITPRPENRPTPSIDTTRHN